MRLLVHEPTSLWTAEFERLWLGQPGLQIRWRPDFDDVLEEAAGDAVVVMAVQEDADTLRKIGDLRGKVHSIACLVAEVSSQWEFAARELGADVILPEVSPKRQVRAAMEPLLELSGKRAS